MRRHILVIAALAMLGVSAILAQDTPHFSAHSDLVVLDVAVTDRRGGFVSGLPQASFRIFEEGRLQDVSFFAEQDAPATIGLLIDSSGSMVENRSRVIAAIETMALASHPEDEFLPLAFNERVTAALPPDRLFTSDPVELRTSLTRNLRAYGRTAFHDALAEALERLSHGTHERRALIILSDGGDNASRRPFNEVLQLVQASNVVIYSVALIDPLSRDQNPKGLRRLADATGGLAFEPERVSAVGSVLGTIALDIRSRYTLAYAPPDAKGDGRLRRIQVTVQGPKGRLNVRTRTGYIPAAPTTAEGSGSR
ncbi:MAG TPA: VWA domain-containing protein [Vicinamibacterales bacterium]|jgi:Ca-activated chloride channel family protein